MQSVYGENKQNCCGCGACADLCPAGAVAMRPDEEGFLYPVIEQAACVDCGVCADACPLLRTDHYKTTTEPRFFVMKHRLQEVLRCSTSGGAFTALSDAVLSLGGTVYGADYDADLRVAHTRAENAAQRDRMRFSKYVQSAQEGIYAQIGADLEAGRTVLFTGTPCQAAGIRARFPQKRGQGTLYVCDLICHSVPSPRVWEDFKRLLEEENGKKLTFAQFRSKTYSWGRANSNKNFQYWLEGDPEPHGDNRFHKFFIHENTIVRPSCYQCRFADKKRCADLTIADYFGIEEFAPEWYDPLGVSLILVSTACGRELMELAAGDMLTEARPAAEALKHQSRLIAPGAQPTARAEFWEYYARYGLGAAFARGLSQHT